MAVPASGTVSLDDIQTEFGGTNPVSLSEYYRDGTYVTSNNTGVPTSGAVSVSEFYGAIKQFIFTITANTQEADLATLATAAGWDGVAPIAATIDSGVYLWSGNAAVAGLTIPVSITSAVTLTNNGYIIGKGGDGNATSGAGGNGGPAVVNNATTVSLINSASAYIAGGGGAGGGYGGAGGAGGGTGGAGRTFGGSKDNLTEGAGGAVGAVGANTTGTLHDGLTHATGGGAGGGGGGGWDTGSNNFGSAAGAGGGRILPGTGGVGALNTIGCGGFGSRGCGGDGSVSTVGSDRNGGAGSGGGGGWGAAGGTGRDGAGGAAGAAISGTAVTLTNSGTVYGATA